MKIIEKKLEDIRPYDNNPRLNDRAVPAVAESLKKFGWQQPIVIDRNGVIVCGHTRYKAALSLGMKTAPCKYADELTPEQVNAYRLADNKTAELAMWDEDKMKEELAKCSKFDMSAFGFEEPPEDPDDVTEDEYRETDDIEHVAEYGMVFELGEHRLMCGDSTKKEDLENLLGGVLPKLVFTDPPYGVSIGDKNKLLEDAAKAICRSVKKNIEGDTMNEQELHDMLVAAFSNLREHAAQDCSYYVTAPQNGSLGMMFMMMMKEAGLEVRHNLVWVKNAATFSLGRLDYDYKHEPIFYTWTKSHNFYGGAQNTVIDDTKPLEKMNKAELKELVHALKDGKETSVIYCDKPLHSNLHPTMKPIKLIARFIINSSRKGEPVADIFGGSGSTIMACEQLSRKCYTMELDPHYCDVIIDRWEKYTGKKAKRIK